MSVPAPRAAPAARGCTPEGSAVALQLSPRQGRVPSWPDESRAAEAAVADQDQEALTAHASARAAAIEAHARNLREPDDGTTRLLLEGLTDTAPSVRRAALALFSEVLQGARRASGPPWTPDVEMAMSSALDLVFGILAGPCEDADLRGSAQAAVILASQCPFFGIAAVLDGLYKWMTTLVNMYAHFEAEERQKDAGLGAVFSTLAALIRGGLSDAQGDLWGEAAETAVHLQAAVWDAAPALRLSIGDGIGPLAKAGAQSATVAVYQELGVGASSQLLEGLEAPEISALFQLFAEADEERGLEDLVSLDVSSPPPYSPTTGHGLAPRPSPGARGLGRGSPTFGNPHVIDLTNDGALGREAHNQHDDELMNDILEEVGLVCESVRDDVRGRQAAQLLSGHPPISPKIPGRASADEAPLSSPTSLDDDLRALGLEVEWLC